MTDEHNSRAAGGHARAKALTSRERSEIAKRAAAARWEKDSPEAIFEGDFNLGNKTIDCAVLPDGTRVISQATFLRALGRSRSPKAGTGVLSSGEQLPFFLSAAALRPYISEDLIESTKPIFYRSQKGGKAVGYDAAALPNVAEVYLKFRDDLLESGKKIPLQFAHIVKAADVLIRGLANVGIIALVDEATGYQDVRDRRALQKILDTYLARELAAWAKRFPDEFYKQIFRLRGWHWRGVKVNKPQVVAKYTNDIVYDRLAPGIREELEQKNPKDKKGRRKARHHQWLTDDVGHPALAQHLHGVIMLMKTSTSWDEFMVRLDMAAPKKGQSLSMPFD
ncbi:P63C domain-containing protein [Marinimicrobium agarilyticum]|uniref:P63C domain-containing protein n=1 Tax=Marinimicrobium agarilyticum TaxID=306546 RepID=UPI000428664F|nr:P63C domain-containing protein [Marinimicrobium agarilyticum]